MGVIVWVVFPFKSGSKFFQLRLVAHKNVLRMGNSRASQVVLMPLRPTQGNGVRMMETLTPLEHLFLHFLRELSEQQRQDVLRILEVLVQSQK